MGKKEQSIDSSKSNKINNNSFLFMKYYDLFATVEESNPVIKEEIDDKFIVSIPHTGTRSDSFIKFF